MEHPALAEQRPQLVAATFIFFIPLDERQLLRLRGEEYGRCMEVMPYPLLRGIW